MFLLKIVCDQCGSDDVRRDATVAWDVESQTWELCTVFDSGICEHCGGTTLGEIPMMDADTLDLLLKHERIISPSIEE